MNIPKDFEKVEHHDHLTLWNSDRGIIIGVSEKDELDQRFAKSQGLDHYKYRVGGSKNQKKIYEGSFQSLSNAEEKVIELAQKYSEIEYHDLKDLYPEQ